MSAQEAVRTAHDAPDFCPHAEASGHQSSAHASVHRYSVHFTGEGQSYWPIALKNALLMVLTLGLWWPWAQAHRSQYLAGHLFIDGVQPIRQYTTSRRHSSMFVALAAGLWLTIWGYFQNSPIAWLGALASAALAPAWWHYAYRANVRALSWQGLRWQATTALSQTYRLCAVPLIGLTSFLGLGIALGIWGGEGQAARAGQISMATVCLGGVFMLPYCHWRLIRHQQHHLALPQMRMRFRASPMDLYRIWAHTTLMGAMSMMAALGLYGLLAFWAWSVLPAGATHTWLQTMTSMGPVGLVFAGFSLVLPASYLQTHVHNLRWSHTGSEWLRFKSYLKTRDQLSMNAQHLLKLLGSAGLYWPYASMQRVASRMESITIVTRLSTDQLREMSRVDQHDQAA